MKNKSVLTGALWGIGSFVFVHIIIPLLSVGLPDIVWIVADLCISAAAFIMLYQKSKPSLLACLAVGFSVWVLLLTLFAAPLSKLYGIALTGLGVFEYIGVVALWPIACCAFSAMAVLIYMKIKK